MTAACGHPLCELIGGACSIATRRSRGCTPGLASKSVAPEVYDEVRVLVAVIEGGVDVRDAAIRLATIVRREAQDDRLLVVLARTDEPDLAPALARLCARR